MYITHMLIIIRRGQRISKGGGRDFDCCCVLATRPEEPRLRRDRVQGCTGFARGAQARPKGPRIRAEARRAEAAGDGVQGRGVPFPWVRKFLIFEPL